MKALSKAVPVPGHTTADVFVALTGQRDNIGDSLLRRGLLSAVPSAARRHVLVGPSSDDYMTGLGLAADDVVYTDRRRWMTALAAAALRRRTSLVMNAGEIAPDRAFSRARLLLLPVIVLTRLRGGAAIQAGLGVRKPSSPSSVVLRRLLAMAQLVVWRDEASRAWAGRGTVAPDWGLGLGPGPEDLRRRHDTRGPRRLVVSLRGDRAEPSAEVLGLLKSAVSETGATPVVVCQVRRDNERAAWLAHELDGELVSWPTDRSHADQEAVLRAEYASATWVASDRLHVVIAAMTEGAVPLVAVPDTTRKVARTLAGLDLAPVEPLHAAEQLASSQEALRLALGTARERLQVTSERVADLIEGRATPRPVRVLHSMSSPDTTTRYATHMAATEDLDVRPVFFTWARALFGRFDRFHLHWPEHLVPGGTSLKARARRALANVVVARMERRRTPVIRTMHNLTPHDTDAFSEASRLRLRFDALTQVDIHLVEDDPAREGVSTVLIPHGSYREPYAVHPVPPRIPGRVLFFGMLKPYKGIPELLDAFSAVPGGSLRIVGAPADSRVVEAVQNATALDPRVSAEYGFITDAALSAEIGEADLVALPYRELHSSGVVLVALSLCRPVLVPRTTTTEALMREVGTDWVRLYEGTLTAAELSVARTWAAAAVHAPVPNLAGRSWAAIRDSHGAVYGSL